MSPYSDSLIFLMVYLIYDRHYFHPGNQDLKLITNIGIKILEI